MADNIGVDVSRDAKHLQMIFGLYSNSIEKKLSDWLKQRFTEERETAYAQGFYEGVNTKRRFMGVKNGP